MENASKALIIAGSILISILLISVGILVFNAVNQPVQEAQGQGSAQAAQIFNSKYEQYVNSKQTASNTKGLIQAVQANNAANDRKITLTGVTAATSINSAKTYKVEVAYDSDGYINQITITQN